MRQVRIRLRIVLDSLVKSIVSDFPHWMLLSMKTMAKTRRISTIAPVRRWKEHLANWKAYALASGASLAAGTNADAQIVYATVDKSISGNGASSKLTFAVNGHSVLAIQTHQPGIAGASFGTALIGGKGGIKFYHSGGFGLNYEKGCSHREGFTQPG